MSVLCIAVLGSQRPPGSPSLAALGLFVLGHSMLVSLGISGKSSIHRLSACICDVSFQSVVLVLISLGVGSQVWSCSRGSHSCPNHLSSWLPLGTLYRCSAVFCMSKFSLIFIG